MATSQISLVEERGSPGITLVMDYLSPLEKQFRQHADKERAAAMARYMKDHFQYFGIPSPERNAIEKEFLAQYGKPPVEKLPSIIKEAYKKPQREFQYFIIGLTCKYIKKELPEDFIRTTHFMVVNKSWWDTVDWIASWIVGGLVKKYPDLVNVMDDWIESDNMWLQRTAILHQLKYKKETDEKRLFDYCRKCASSKEFFLRKAIGWALREYSGTNPNAVKKFVKETVLSALSQKEALRKIT